ncbi:hypothetical protein L596_005850 [Steinernema carpocapsae]|uniref:Uncharacterized protein n=1 Tax=Steinernema carpocapsae TaxID=34508 RepID=A0A4U8V0K3_STECR|nr:hypothetical protein L596_005850 [Steinernema carpocapsae]
MPSIACLWVHTLLEQRREHAWGWSGQNRFHLEAFHVASLSVAASSLSPTRLFFYICNKRQTLSKHYEQKSIHSEKSCIFVAVVHVPNCGTNSKANVAIALQ